MKNKINEAFVHLQNNDLLTFKVTQKHLAVLQQLAQQTHCKEAVIKSVAFNDGKLSEQFFVVIGKDQRLIQQYCNNLKQINLCLGKVQRWHALTHRGLALTLIYELALLCVPLFLHKIMLYAQSMFIMWMFVLPIIMLGMEFYFHHQLNSFENSQLKNAFFCEQQAHVTCFEEDDFNGE